MAATVDYPANFTPVIIRELEITIKSWREIAGIVDIITINHSIRKENIK